MTYVFNVKLDCECVIGVTVDADSFAQARAMVEDEYPDANLLEVERKP